MSSEDFIRLRLAWNGQPKHRSLPWPGDVQSFRVVWIRQIQRLAVLAAINLGIFSPGFFRVAALLLQHIVGVEPALQMSAAELALFVLLVAGPLSALLELHFVMRQLGNSYRASGHVFPSLSGNAAEFGCPNFILLEGFCGMPEPNEEVRLSVLALAPTLAARVDVHRQHGVELFPQADVPAKQKEFP